MSARFWGLSMFLVIAFVPAWLWIYVAVGLLELSMVNPLVQLGFAFTPAIAAVVVRRWVSREGFADAGMRLRLRAAWPYYLSALLGPFALAALTMVVAVGLGVWEFDLSMLATESLGIPWWSFVVIPVLLAPLYWGEEFGWTAYLRQRLFVGSPMAATLVTGLIWAVWHFPLAFSGYIEFGNVVLGLAVWTVSFSCQEVILSWLMVRSGSVWPSSVAHGGNNMVLFFFTGMLLEQGAGMGALGTTVLPTIPMAAVSVWLVLSGRLAAARRAGDIAVAPAPVRTGG